MKYRSLALAALPLALVLGQALAQHGPSEEEKERIRVRIGITREQNSQIEAIYAEDRRQDMELRGRMGELYRQLDTVYDDRSQASIVRKQICGLYRQRIAIHADTQEKLRRVLNRDQFARLTAMVHEWRDRFRKDHQWGGGPGRGPGGPHGQVP